MIPSPCPLPALRREGGRRPGEGFVRTGGHKVQAHLHVEAGLDFFALEGADALLEQLTIQLEAHSGDVPALLGTEQVARAADFQVAHGDFESAAEAGVLLNGADAFARIGQKTGMTRQEQISISLVFETPDAAPQLIEIAQAETVGPVND